MRDRRDDGTGQGGTPTDHTSPAVVMGRAPMLVASPKPGGLWEGRPTGHPSRGTPAGQQAIISHIKYPPPLYFPIQTK